MHHVMIFAGLQWAPKLLRHLVWFVYAPDPETAVKSLEVDADDLRITHSRGLLSVLI